jgi:predicted lipid-binding transport protein (Tim44 family)
MFKLRVVLAAFLAVGLLMAPQYADARAGGSKSSGSRGSQTYAPTPAKPMERSTTAKPDSAPGVQPGAAGTRAATPVGSPARGGLFGSPMMTGLLGGFLGAGLFGLLFSNSAWAADGASGGMGMLGLLLQLGLIAALVYFGVKLFRRMTGQTQPSMAGASFGTAGFGRGADFDTNARTAGYEQAPQAGPEITDTDRQAFGDILAQTQVAWSDGDLARLRALATPEMVSYFADDMAEAASRGERNIVRDPVLLKGDVVENWIEGDRQYVTAVLTWRAVDYVERDGRVVSGDSATAVEATEAWTFMRTPGGRWLLSAIQQI